MRATLRPVERRSAASPSADRRGPRRIARAGRDYARRSSFASTEIAPSGATSTPAVPPPAAPRPPANLRPTSATTPPFPTGKRRDRHANPHQTGAAHPAFPPARTETATRVRPAGAATTIPPPASTEAPRESRPAGTNHTRHSRRQVPRSPTQNPPDRRHRNTRHSPRASAKIATQNPPDQRSHHTSHSWPASSETSRTPDRRRNHTHRFPARHALRNRSRPAHPILGRAAEECPAATRRGERHRRLRSRLRG